jgi:hypothetical protein
MRSSISRMSLCRGLDVFFNIVLDSICLIFVNNPITSTIWLLNYIK